MKRLHQSAAWTRKRANGTNLLHILCPLRLSSQCHKCTVGEDSAHDHHTKQFEKQLSRKLFVDTEHKGVITISIRPPTIAPPDVDHVEKDMSEPKS